MTRRHLFAGAALICTVALTACSSGPAPVGSAAPTAASATATVPTVSSTAVSGSPAPADVPSAVTTAVGDWLDASTPEAACAAASRGFSQFLGSGGQAPPGRCVDNIVATLGGELQHGPFTVQAVALDNGQAVATVSIPSVTPAPVVFWFVQEGPVWKLNSIGDRRPAG